MIDLKSLTKRRLIQAHSSNSEDYSGDYSGDYSSEFSGDYSGDYSGDFSADYSRDYSGDYSGYYSGDYSGDYSADYSGDYYGINLGTISGLAVVSDESDCGVRPLARVSHPELGIGTNPVQPEWKNNTWFEN